MSFKLINGIGRRSELKFPKIQKGIELIGSSLTSSVTEPDTFGLTKLTTPQLETVGPRKGGLPKSFFFGPAIFASLLLRRIPYKLSRNFQAVCLS